MDTYKVNPLILIIRSKTLLTDCWTGPDKSGEDRYTVRT
jgi:hypothetical protein